MDLNRLPNDKKLQLCRWYFRVGCLLLPFAWAVNAVWFFNEAFVKPPFEEQKQIKKYVLISAVGAAVWACALIAWVTVFQMNRVLWGATGDMLSFIVPLGRA
ncbi:Gamma-secretase subunit pen-2 [Papilio machaon]|uniref:Gamma-secretase subunit PEN-2 n=1 Tax=Papilio machaon TaxID=76193 RepID=A0A194RJ04_PAPMA|nr:gamma-secretase subunit pen-2 [Papilio machaon]KPJ17419.1 Gamma-secretase subunit pen-2 [Papilio machaon]